MGALEELRGRAEEAAETVGGAAALAKRLGINRISLQNFLNQRLNATGKPRQLSYENLEKLMDAIGVMRHEARVPDGFISADSPQLLQEMVGLHFELLQRELMVDLGISLVESNRQRNPANAEVHPLD